MAVDSRSDYSKSNLPFVDATTPIAADRIDLTDVPGQFERLTVDGDILAANDSGTFKVKRRYRYTGTNQTGVDDPKNHLQGAQRLGSSQYMVISGGDSTEPAPHLFLLKMGTRPKKGMWGSNLTSRGEPHPDDGIERVIALESDNWHPGGLGLLGDILVVPMQEAVPRSEIQFVHVGDPEEPARFPPNITIRRPEYPHAGAASLNRMSDGRFLCAVWHEDSDGPKPTGRLCLYLSNSANFRDGFVGKPIELKFPTSVYQKVGRDVQYQAIALLPDASPDPAPASGERFYLLCTENTSDVAPFINGRNMADLLELRVVAPSGGDPADWTATLEHVNTREFHAPREYCNFDAIAGAYVDSSGPEPRLHLYAGYHFRVNDTIRFAEFFGVPADGNRITDIADGWVQLFDGTGCTGRHLTVYGDADPIKDYSRIYVQNGDFDDVVLSARWQLPVGSRYRLYRNAGLEATEGNPSTDLEGTGVVTTLDDLRARTFAKAVSSSKIVRD